MWKMLIYLVRITNHFMPCSVFIKPLVQWFTQPLTRRQWRDGSWGLMAMWCCCLLGVLLISRAELSWAKPESDQHTLRWANPKVCFVLFCFMIPTCDQTLGRLLFAKIYPKLQEIQAANWLIYKKASQTEQNAPVIRTVHAFPLDTLYGRASDRGRQVF